MTAYNISQIGNIAHQIYKLIDSDSVIMLRGELGVGKTTLASNILQDLLEDEGDFTSPTFNIVHEYYSQLKKCKVFHLDLYRIKSYDELGEIGFSDMLSNGIMLIEWPEVSFSILNTLSEERLIMINLSFITEEIRGITISRTCKID